MCVVAAGDAISGVKTMPMHRKPAEVLLEECPENKESSRPTVCATVNPLLRIGHSR